MKNTVICKYCKEEILAGSRICKYCGSHIKFFLAFRDVSILIAVISFIVASIFNGFQMKRTREAIKLQTYIQVSQHVSPTEIEFLKNKPLRDNIMDFLKTGDTDNLTEESAMNLCAALREGEMYNYLLNHNYIDLPKLKHDREHLLLDDYDKDFFWKSVKGAYTLKSDEIAKKMAAEIYPETHKARKTNRTRQY